MDLDATVFRVDPAVFEAFPRARFFAVVVRGIDNTRHADEAARRLQEAVAATHDRFAGQDPKAEPAIAIWREVFGARGWTPSKYLSSIEALVRRVAKGGKLPSINPAVDLGNVVSLTHLLPLGAHDLGTAPNGITVRITQPGDCFWPMGDGPAETPEPGEIVYAHDQDVRTRRWVWRQSRTGLVTPETTDVLYPIDAFADVTEAAGRAAAQTLANIVPALLGGTATIWSIPQAGPPVPLTPPA